MRMLRLWLAAAALVAGMVLWLLAGAGRTDRPRGAESDAGQASLELRVSLSERKLHVVENGNVTASYPIAIGKSGHRTPAGTFRIGRMIWNPSWVPPDREWARGMRARGPGDPRNPMGRIKIFFREPSYYIHGTPEEASLGRAVSHGCIRMRNADAVALGRLLMEKGGAGRAESWYRRVQDRSGTSQEVRLSRPVRLVVRQ